MKLAGIPYRVAYYLWVNLPDSLREGVSKGPKLKRMKNALRDVLATGGGHDDIYSNSYFQVVDSLATQSAAQFIQVIMENFSPATAVDVGCGTGAMLAELSKRGVRVLGLEYSRSAIEICRRRNLEVREYNIETNRSVTDLGRFDVAICTEVAEHIEVQFADALVDQLVEFSDQIVFTAAVPGQGGGVSHVNEQPNAYWITKFSSRGYTYLAERTMTGRRQLLAAGVAGFYANNLMLFQRKALEVGR
jgi:SAM-dependent methyltransferase